MCPNPNSGEFKILEITEPGSRRKASPKPASDRKEFLESGFGNTDHKNLKSLMTAANLTRDDSEILYGLNQLLLKGFLIVEDASDTSRHNIYSFSSKLSIEL